MITTTAVLAVAALVLAPLASHAQESRDQYTYRCTSKDGKRHYGQTIPQACLGQAFELINRQGMVVRRIDPQADERARLAKEAEAEKKRQLEASRMETMRRHRALLATYTSEKDIEEARKRALSDHQKQIREVEKRIDDIKKRHAQLEKDLEAYQETGKGEPPARLKEEIINAEIDLKAEQGLLEVKKKEAASINARYDEDRKRYAEATGKPR